MITTNTKEQALIIKAMAKFNLKKLIIPLIPAPIPYPRLVGKAMLPIKIEAFSLLNGATIKLLVKEAADLSIIPNKVIKIKKTIFPLIASHNNIPIALNI
ncbi:hypothetical protein IMAU70168_01731 [Lactobacillus helveticus]|nr:hypothetical protein [Lactobacillus helveticus]